MLRFVGGVAAGVVVAGAGLGLASPAFAAVADGLKVAQVNACMGCHAVDRKLVGPSFKDVAAKYKGDAAAQAKLEKKVRDGGAGVWGAIPMPSHPGMSAADIHSVVGWVLAGAPSK
ncbi:c-type cytochrome [Paraburkholderia sp. CNPSo 3274]|uniref:c-type cytochrome n=1 Tax=Paraburkholderia sp. CNPSo 3274 TaxID=2940932 RepID=UPI0020B6CD8E|nr:c-type cytochrome [Paraburkholderia sp. CNPSo 3274]MCP3706825.1 c-type cytochrome [Paraburkholderia sp. CNPSo 3274]